MSYLSNPPPPPVAESLSDLLRPEHQHLELSMNMRPWFRFWMRKQVRLCSVTLVVLYWPFQLRILYANRTKAGILDGRMVRGSRITGSIPDPGSQTVA